MSKSNHGSGVFYDAGYKSSELKKHFIKEIVSCAKPKKQVTFILDDGFFFSEKEKSLLGIKDLAVSAEPYVDIIDITKGSVFFVDIKSANTEINSETLDAFLEHIKKITISHKVGVILESCYRLPEDFFVEINKLPIDKYFFCSSVNRSFLKGIELSREIELESTVFQSNRTRRAA